MVRCRWLWCGLCSALLYTACGESDDDGLFGRARDGEGSKGGAATSVDPSLGEAGSDDGEGGRDGGNASGGRASGAASATGGSASGGRTSATGGRASTPTGGRSAAGGRASSNGGAPSGAGGDGPSAGEPSTGGAADGGTPGETGGVAATGGEPSSTGGASGGSNTGGSNAGGATGGAATGGAAMGGRRGNPACDEARAHMAEALEQARRCDPSEGLEACSGTLENDCGCAEPIDDPSSPAGLAYSEAVTKVRARCGERPCLACPNYVGFVCMAVLEDDGGGLEGRCEGVAVIPDAQN